MNFFFHFPEMAKLSMSEESEYSETDLTRRRNGKTGDLLRNDLPYTVHNYSSILNLADWIMIDEILNHSNMCIFSFHAEGRYIYNITFLNGKVFSINDKMVQGNTVVTKCGTNSYLVEVPLNNLQIQFSYGNPIRFKYSNRNHKNLTVVSRLYPIQISN